MQQQNYSTTFNGQFKSQSIKAISTKTLDTENMFHVQIIISQTATRQLSKYKSFNITIIDSAFTKMFCVLCQCTLVQSEQSILTIHEPKPSAQDQGCDFVFDSFCFIQNSS